MQKVKVCLATNTPEHCSSIDADEIVYFDTRPIGSRIGAWASPQSSVIQSRGELDEYVTKIKDKFDITDETEAEKHLPVPSYWGGLKIIPQRVEFWSGRNNRLHDRLVMTRTENIKESESAGKWQLERLAP